MVPEKVTTDIAIVADIHTALHSRGFPFCLPMQNRLPLLGLKNVLQFYISTYSLVFHRHSFHCTRAHPARQHFFPCLQYYHRLIEICFEVKFKRDENLLETDIRLLHSIVLSFSLSPSLYALSSCGMMLQLLPTLTLDFFESLDSYFFLAKVKWSRCCELDNGVLHCYHHWCHFGVQLSTLQPIDASGYQLRVRQNERLG